MDGTRESILNDVIYIDGVKDGVPVEVAMVYYNSYTENVHSYVNNINTQLEIKMLPSSYFSII